MMEVVIMRGQKRTADGNFVSYRWEIILNGSLAHVSHTLEQAMYWVKRWVEGLHDETFFFRRGEKLGPEKGRYRKTYKTFIKIKHVEKYGLWTRSN